MKRILAALLAAAVLVIGGLALTSITAGEADAQDSDSDTTTVAPLSDALDELVEEGVISQEQADAVEEKLRETFGGRLGRGHRLHHGLEEAAEVIGVDAEQLAEQLADGATLAEVAEANGADPADVIDALVANAEERLAAAVENGRIDQAAADERLAEIEERVTDLVNGELEFPARGELGEGRRFGRGPASDTETSVGA